MLPNFDKKFTVEHDIFYKELEEWREKYLDNQECNECVYFLLSNQLVPRVLNNDTQGILYIGKGLLTKNNERIGELVNSVNGTSNQHEAGVKYQKIKWRYPISGLVLGVVLVSKSRDEETKYLREYFEIFGELPPLNRQS